MGNPWWKGAIVYHIYPLSFKDSNEDGFGDLRGIIQKLDYLEWLGIDAIWLSPIFESPMVDFGYDVSNYKKIGEIFGRMEDFDELLEKLHERKIKLILDQVFNHTSDQHPWFLESRRSRFNPKSDWYVWLDGTPEKPPNNWESFFGGSAWQWCDERRQYYLHLFTKEQPDLNWRNPEVVKGVFDSMRFWLEKGVDGFRFDVVNMYFKDFMFRDNPVDEDGKQIHIFDVDRPETLSMLEKMRIFTKEYGEILILGEVASDGGLCTYFEYSKPGRLDLVFNFEFMKVPSFDAELFKKVIERTERLFKTGWPAYVLGNHDTVRYITRYGGERPLERVKILSTMLLTLRGTIFIYYGEEIGMEEMDIPYDMIKDPEGKNLWPEKKGRDGCRTPMQWDDSKYAGFSSIEPWLPVNENKEKINVKRQMEDPTSLLNHYRSLIKLRKSSKALRFGKLDLIDTPKNVLSYVRSHEGEILTVILNFSEDEVRLNLHEGEGEIIIDGIGRSGKISLRDFIILPLESMVIKLR